MASGIRKANESFGEYRDRLDSEQAAMNRAARGTLVFQSTNHQLMSDGHGIQSFKQVGPGMTAQRGSKDYGVFTPSSRHVAPAGKVKPRLSRKGNRISGTLPRLSGY